MDGFDKNDLDTGAPAGTFPYAYLDRAKVAPYWAMAQQYTLADHLFPTMFGGSFTAHLDLIGGTANLSPSVSEVDYPSAQPWGCDASAGVTTHTLSAQGRTLADNGPHPCFTQFRTMADTLDAARATWKYYACREWWRYRRFADRVRRDPERAVRSGPTANFPAPTAVFADARAGSLPNVAWVIPTFSIPTTPLATPDHRGLRRSSTRSAKDRNGSLLPSSFCGTTGAAGTTTSGRRRRISGASAFACRPSSFRRIRREALRTRSTSSAAS